MAEQDVGKGFGTIPGDLDEWDCPYCGCESKVMDWAVCTAIINQHRLEGRQCPKCSRFMSTVGDTDQSMKRRLDRVVAAKVKKDKPEKVKP